MLLFRHDEYGGLRPPPAINMCICIHIHRMTSKNLAIREDVYRRLRDAKRGNESFSDVIDRLLEGKHDLMVFAGILSDDETFTEMVADMDRVRKETKLRN